ncbi:MAG: hypothetical protein ABEH64_11100 [Salinirussus sp.]
MVNRRGQLILIGAVLLATVIFGLSFLLNSMLYAGATATGSTTAAVGEADQIGFEVQRGVRPLVIRVNHAARNITASGLATAVNSNVTRFSKLYGESKAAAGSTAVAVAYDNATSEFGTRIVQVQDAEFLDPSGDLDWKPVDDSAAVGWFTVNVDLENSTVNPAVFNVSNSSNQIDYTLERNGTNVTVTSDPDWTGPVSTECGETGGRVLLDMFAGTAYTSDCAFNGTGRLSGMVEEIRIDHGDRIEGRFSIVANRSATPVGHCTTGTPVTDPCRVPAVWTANLSVSVTGQQVRYDNAFNLSVYPGAGS